MDKNHFVLCVQIVSFTKAEYVRSDVEDTKKSLKDTIVPAVRHCTEYFAVFFTSSCLTVDVQRLGI